jgi:hypothetical protein
MKHLPIVHDIPKRKYSRQTEQTNTFTRADFFEDKSGTKKSETIAARAYCYFRQEDDHGAAMFFWNPTYWKE